LFSKEGFGSVTAFLAVLVAEVSPWKSWVWQPRAGGRWSLCPLPKISLKLSHLREIQGTEVDSAVIVGMFWFSEAAHR